MLPPRTNSSLVEHVIGNSQDIENECHEPFLKARKDSFDPDHGYQQIYESIGGEEFEQSTETTSVIVKEMSHWIGKNKEYKRFANLTANPIIVLIRNPLLSVESRIRRVLTTMDMRYSIHVQRYLLDDLAKENGFPDWNNFLEVPKREPFKEFLENFQDGNIERLYDNEILTIQNQFLDLKAQKNGYFNWKDIIQKKLYEERDYAFFEGLLKTSTRRLDFEKNEFKKLLEEVDYFKEHGIDYAVFDTTDLRAAPEEQVREICSLLKIKFSPEMLDWNNSPIDFHTEQTKQSEKLWYDSLFSSSRINPPTEITPKLNMFPKFIQDYLRADDLTIYTELSKEKIISDNLRNELNEREFNTRITMGNEKQLRELGIIGDATEIGNKIPIKLKHLDPIYAVTNDPGLIDNPEFKKLKNNFKGEIDIMSSNASEKNERDNHMKEFKFR